MIIIKTKVMSLDVYLYKKRWVSYDGGKTLERDDENVYSANITHNLNNMAQKAGIYEALWRPYRLKWNRDFDGMDSSAELEYEKNTEILAGEIIPILKKGLEDLQSRPNYFKQFDSPNGWGKYEHFVPFVKEYLRACIQYPDAVIKVSR